MLKTFTTRVVDILACEISADGEMKVLDEGRWNYQAKGAGALRTNLDFSVSADQEPEVGDYIIQESKSDCYLCKKAVFDRKYSPKGGFLL